MDSFFQMSAHPFLEKVFYPWSMRSFYCVTGSDFLKSVFIYFMCMGILSASKSVPHACLAHSEALQGLELYIDGCKLPCTCWQLNLAPLKEYHVLTVEPPLFINFLKSFFHQHS